MAIFPLVTKGEGLGMTRYDMISSLFLRQMMPETLKIAKTFNGNSSSKPVFCQGQQVNLPEGTLWYTCKKLWKITGFNG